MGQLFRLFKFALFLGLLSVCTQFCLASGRVTSWGYYWKGKSNIFVPVNSPPLLNDPIAIAGGAGHSLALLANGAVVGWGDNTFGQASVPAGLTGVVAIAAGDYHSLALRSDGTVVAWGDNSDGQAIIPPGLTNVIAISSAFFHNLALKADGKVVAWGASYDGLTNAPADLQNVVAISCRNSHSLALKADGTVVAWGNNFYGQIDVPLNLTNAVAISAGDGHSLALTADGRLIGWGDDYFGQTTVPAGLDNIAFFVAGGVHNLALRTDDSVVAWGAGTNIDLSTGGDYGQSIVPANLTNVAAVAAGYIHSLALLRDGPPILFAPAVNRTVLYGANAWLSVPASAVQPLYYQWKFGGTNLPNGTSALLTLSNVTFSEQGVYSLLVSNRFGVATSSNMMLTVVPLLITNQPRSQAAIAGSTITLTVGPKGQGPFAYQWQFNGADIPGATSNTLVLAHATSSDSGTYAVIVSNLAGSVRSADAILTISDEAVVYWGNNLSGLTNGTLGFTNVVAVAVGLRHGLALQADGKVLAWGASPFGQTNVPSDLTNAVAVAAGNSHSLALRADGKVVGWGHSNGVGTIPADLDNVAAIAAGSFHNLALKSDSTVVAWGNNFDAAARPSGQTNVPPGLTNVIAVAAGQAYSMALKADGTIVSWGTNFSVPANLTNVVAIAGGAFHGLALRANGTVAAWGQNSSGEATVPPGLTNVIAIAAGDYHNLALKKDGTVVAWGAGGTNVIRPPPFPPPGPHDQGQSVVPAGLTNVTAIAAGYSQSVAVVGGGRPFLTGPLLSRLAIYGQTLNLRIAAQGAGPLSYQWMFNGTNLPGATNATLTLSSIQFSSGGTYSVRVSNAFGETVSSDMTLSVAPLLITAQPQSQGTFLGASVLLNVAASGQGPMRYQWRFNGTNLAGATNNSLLLANLRGEQSGSYSVLVTNAVGSALSTDAVLSVGEIIAWGNNDFGQTNLPFGLTNIVAIASGEDHSLALRADGTLVAWGNNDYGQTNVPLGLTNAVAVAGGSRHSLAIKADSTVIGWGHNDLHQISIPPGLSNVIAIAAGGFHSLALRANGTVAAWGYNDSGQTRVPNGLTNVISVAAGLSHSVALKADGTVTVWGDDGWGESVIPAGLTNVIAVTAGYQHTVALKADGTVSVWGATYAGQTNMPPGLTNVIAISAGGHHTLAMMATRELITWGDTVSIPVPAAVTNIRAFAAGAAHNLALLGDTPLILMQPVDIRVIIGSNATFSVVATGTPSPTFQWHKDGIDIPGATASVLALNSVQANAGGSYSVTVSNEFGVLMSSNALLTINHPPIADASATRSQVVSSNNNDAIVVLDGSRSFDEDGDGLQYLWSDVATGNRLGTGVVAVVVLPLGTNLITLSVSDGSLSAQQTISVEVLTAGQAMERLIDLVKNEVSKPQPLVATLSAALASINRGNLIAAVEQLGAFRNKVAVEVAPVDPALATRLVQDSQAVAAILGDHGNRKLVVAIRRQPNGKVRLQLSDRPDVTCIIEASTNLLNWEALTSAPSGCQGGLEFEDPKSAELPVRYYRVVEP